MISILEHHVGTKSCFAGRHNTHVAEYIPTWRKPRAKRRRPNPGAGFGWTSVLALIFAWSPAQGHSPYIPISLQLQNRELSAWALFGLLALLFGFLGLRLARFERLGSMVFLWSGIPLLGYIATSDPFSLNHLFAFISLSLMATVWMLWIAWDLEDRVLQTLSVLAVASIFCSFVSLGIGERLLVTAAVAFGATLLYEHCDDRPCPVGV